MAKLTKIKVFSLVKLQTVLAALLGFLAGVIYSMGGFFVDVFVSMGWISVAAAETPGLSYGTVLAFGALVGMPIIFALFGFLLGLIEAMLFNLLAGWFKGLEIDL